MQRSRLLPLVLILLFERSSCGRVKERPRALAKSAVLEVYLVSPSSAANTRAAVDPQTGTQVYLVVPPVIASADVATIQRSEDSPARLSMTVNLTPPGAQKLSVATTPAVGQPLAIVVNGKVMKVGKVRSTLSKSFVISGGSIQKDREEIFEALTEE